jgi:hypothetical protein
MPRFDAPSISATSSEIPAVISVHDVQALHGSAPFCSPDARRSQFSALARMRAVVVLPTPRAPENKYACAMRPVSTARVSTSLT